MTDTIWDTKLPFGRVEIRTGVGWCRRWTAQEKGRIVAETLSAGGPVAEIVCPVVAARDADEKASTGEPVVGRARRGR
jgi:hypothetical protein